MSVTVPPAPGADRHPALDFANSLLSAGELRGLDLLASPAAATAWLIDHRLAPPDAVLHEICAERLRAFRARLRELLAAVATGEPAPQSALDAVNLALTTVPSASLLGWDEDRGLHRVPVHPADRVAEHAMAALAADAAELLTGADAGLLTVCGAADCTRVLLRTHASRHWCSTRCGDRVRAARAYARKRAAD
jgi:predicted RNA-binding Zn ribbon-like protein